MRVFKKSSLCLAKPQLDYVKEFRSFYKHLFVTPTNNLWHNFEPFISAHSITRDKSLLDTLFEMSKLLSLHEEMTCFRE